MTTLSHNIKLVSSESSEADVTSVSLETNTHTHCPVDCNDVLYGFTLLALVYAWIPDVMADNSKQAASIDTEPLMILDKPIEPRQAIAFESHGLGFMIL